MNIAVVTGAGRGLGRKIAEALGAKGYTILATDLVEEAAAETARRVGGGAWAMVHDVRDPAAHRAVAEAAHERGDVKLWVNNAGVLETEVDWEARPGSLELHTEVNFYGVVHGSRAAVEVMRRTAGGHIINIASISALTPAPGLSVYAATKHAVLGYSLSLAGELATHGLPIEVSTVCPDAIDTPMVRAVSDRSTSDLLFSARKLLTADDVARVVASVADSPRLVTIHPPVRGALAQLVRPFPGLGLRLLRGFRRLGARHRRRAA